MRLREVLTAMVMSGSLVFWAGGGWAQEATPVSGADTATLPSEQKPAALLPDLSFAILEDGRVGIQAVGFNRSQVSRFIFDGQDVTGVIEDLRGNGILEGTNVVIEDAEGTIYPAEGFEMKLSVDSTILEGHSFGVVLINGLELRKTVEFKSDKWGFGICFVYHENGRCKYGITIGGHW
jgi:hypothetical protein